MIVLVDTSVWIEFLADREIDQAKKLESLLINKDSLCICGIILTEVLQGIRKEKDYTKTREFFDSLLFLPMNYSTYLRAAEIYRSLRKQGITIRNSLDCLIASVAIEDDISLLHNDRDFEPIAKHFQLKTI